MGSFLSRHSLFSEQHAREPRFRWSQIERSFFDPKVRGWEQVHTIPQKLRLELRHEIPWMSVESLRVFESVSKDTYKAVLVLRDHARIETVLMKNSRGQWTICLSSQVGCAMRCAFCATGTLGLTRNLIDDEIVDQYRYWQGFLSMHPDFPQRISNVVFMGMGEPLANYYAVKRAIASLLTYTDIGNTHITVSTVGVLPLLEKMLYDKEWPAVRLAISLHSAHAETRKIIVPSSYEHFLSRLKEWSKKYLELHGNRRHHITFEHIMLHGVNDTLRHAKILAAFVNSIGDVKVNLIPYNITGHAARAGFSKSSPESIEKFAAYLKAHGVRVTVRKSMGDDIAAACGQLVAERS